MHAGSPYITKIMDVCISLHPLDTHFAELPDCSKTACFRVCFRKLRWRLTRAEQANLTKVHPCLLNPAEAFDLVVVWQNSSMLRLFALVDS